MPPVVRFAGRLLPLSLASLREIDRCIMLIIQKHDFEKGAVLAEFWLECRCPLLPLSA